MKKLRIRKLLKIKMQNPESGGNMRRYHNNFAVTYAKLQLFIQTFNKQMLNVKCLPRNVMIRNTKSET